MFLDNRALFSDDQAITASAASTESYDLGAAGKTYDGAQIQRNMGKAGHIPLLIQITEDFDNLTDLKIALQSDDDPAFGSPKEVASETILLADLKAGKISSIDKLPRGVKERYLRFFYTVNGAAPSQGKITAGFVAAVDGGFHN